MVKTTLSIGLRTGVLALAAVMCLPVPVSSQGAQNEVEIGYLLAGMQQEREKLRSGRCLIDGKNVTTGPYEMKYLFKGDSFRFKRTRKAAPGEVEHVCDNREQIVFWDGLRGCSIIRSAPAERRGLFVRDPRLSGLSLIGLPEPSIQRFIQEIRPAWTKKATVSRDKNIRTMTFTVHDQFSDGNLIMKIDTARGFSPISYKAVESYTNESKFPGKVEVQWEFSSEWKQVQDVWVPTFHRELQENGKVLIEEQRMSWEAVNEEIPDREFTSEAFNMPPGIKCLDLRNPMGIIDGENDSPSTSPRSSRLTLVILFGAGVLCLWAMWWAWRRFRHIS